MISEMPCYLRLVKCILAVTLPGAEPNILLEDVRKVVLALLI